jgi:hypothetical protein
MAILSIRRWERETYEVGRIEAVPAQEGRPAVEAVPGIPIHMKLRRLKRHEAKPLARVLLVVFAEFDKAKDGNLTDTQKAAILSQAYEQIPEEQLKAWFGTCVKDVEDFEIDGEPITSGPALLEEADDRLLFWLLMKLHSLSQLSQAEGNASASRSTLRLVGEGSGASPAQSTEREAGERPSTATETQSAQGSSTAQV